MYKPYNIYEDLRNKKYKIFREKPTEEELEGMNDSKVCIDFEEDFGDWRDLGITHLLFTDKSKYNGSMEVLPKTLEYLEFASYFNGSLDNLPGCLKYLTFSYYSRFNGSLDNLPRSLEYLKLGINFCGGLDNLPESLLYLSLSCNIHPGYLSKEQAKDLYAPMNFLPSKLEVLVVQKNYVHNLDNLPGSLRLLRIPELYMGDIILPENCEMERYYDIDDMMRIIE